MHDLQQALRACELLSECDEDQKYSRAELRRFRCYETALVISYTRPFTQSRGHALPLSMKMANLKLSDDSRALHDRLVEMRNKIVAHSDNEMMRMTIQPFDVFEGEDGRPALYMLQTVFDEGITLLGPLLNEVSSLIQQVYQAITRTLYKETQVDPKSFDIRVDYLNAQRRD